MTFEDNIHQPTVDGLFQTSLREKDTLSKPKDFSMSQPPHFQQDDMDKWMEKKFEHSIKEHNLQKERNAKQGSALPLGTSNLNSIRKQPLKRRYSRGSAPAFENVDFNYTGNTADVSHLIKHAKGGTNHAPSDLNFEVNLRTWKPERTITTHEEPFKYPKQSEADFNPVQTHKGQFLPLKGRAQNPEYRERYPDKNFNNVRCFKTLTTKHQKTLLQWQTSLREVGGKEWSWDNKQKSLVTP